MVPGADPRPRRKQSGRAKALSLGLLLLVLLDAGLALYFTYLTHNAGRSVGWVGGKPLRWFNELLILAGASALPSVVFGVLKRIFRIFGKRFAVLDDARSAVILGFGAFTLYLLAIFPEASVRTHGLAGEWLYDEYVGVRVPEQVSGTLLSAEGYDLTIEVQNRTSMELYISQVTVRRFNERAAKLLGGPKADALIYTAEDHVPLFLGPHARDKKETRGNQLLPRRAEVLISHSLSAQPSRFTIDLGGVERPLVCRQPLETGDVYRGMDALVAIKKGRERALLWNPAAVPVVAFPGDNTTYMNAKTGLKVLEIEGWVVNFCSPEGKMFVTVVSEKHEFREQEIEKKGACVWADVPLPKLGNQEALELASRNRLLCGDWMAPRLVLGKVGARSLSMKMRQSVSEFSVERCVFMIDSPCAPESCAVG